MRPLVLHAADLHLDAPFEGIGRTPAHVAAALRDASLAAWDALIELALSRQVAAVLLAGGLCDGLERGARPQARLRDGIGRLAAAGVRVFIALGDRDPLDGFAAVSQWPYNVTVFAPGAPTSYWLECDGVRIASVHGVSADASRPAAPPPRFMRSDAPGPHLAVLHADCAAAASATPTGGCAPLRLGDLHAAGMDYWALGHQHTLDYRSTGSPWIVYPGTLQGRGLAAAECGPKGAVLVEIAGGGITRVDFEPLDQVRCVRVELPDAPDPAAAVRALTLRAAELHERHPGRGLLLDAHVHGTAPVARGLRRAAARAELLRGLRRAAQAWEPFVWWAGLHIDAALADDAYAAGLPAADDLGTEVRRRQAELTADAEQAARFLARRCEPLRSAWTADLDPRETERLLEEAADRAVDALREDGA